MIKSGFRWVLSFLLLLIGAEMGNASIYSGGSCESSVQQIKATVKPCYNSPWSVLLNRLGHHEVRMVVEPGVRISLPKWLDVSNDNQLLSYFIRGGHNVAMVWSMDRYSQRKLTEIHLLASGLEQRDAVGVIGDGRSQAHVVANEILLKFKVGISKHQQSEMLLRHGLRLIKAFPSIGVVHLKVMGDGNLQRVIEQLQSSDLVEYAEPNYRRRFRALPNDPLFSGQWALLNSGQSIPDPSGLVTGAVGEDMGLRSAWDISTGNKSVVVAVLDDAVDINQPDLAANIWVNSGEIAGNGKDDDGNGYVDDVHGWDFGGNDNDPRPDVGMGEGHGTAVAGLIGAVGNNGIGISGVAWRVSIMPLKFAYDVAGEISAINYAIANGANIINASFGGPDFSQAEEDAITLLQKANILFVAAAGNNDTNNDAVADFPSGLPNGNILSVAASDGYRRLTSWSQYGAFSVDVAAPGSALLTTMSASSPIGNGGALDYDYTQGTSFSAPLTVGVAALLKAQYPTAGYAELRGRIMAGVDPIAAATGVLSTDGRVNARHALDVLPTPVLVIRGFSLQEIVGDGDGVADVGETIDLNVTLENGWRVATGITATLRSTDPGVRVLVGQVHYPDLITDDYALPLTPFRIRIDQVSGHQRILLNMNIIADGGYQVHRTIPLELGSLLRGVHYNEKIQRNDQDDVHIFHVNVPLGASNLTVSTTAGSDIDLIVRQDRVPAFGLNAGHTRINSRDPYTLISGSVTGNETIKVTAPKAGVYFVVVVNAAQQANTAYTIQADYTIVDGDGDGVPDQQDAFPQDPALALDSDSDGFADGWLPSATAEQIAASIQSGTQLDAFPTDVNRWQGQSYRLTDYYPSMVASDKRVYRAIDSLDLIHPLQKWVRVNRGSPVQMQSGVIANTMIFSDGTIKAFTNDGSGWRRYHSDQIANPVQGVLGYHIDYYSFATPSASVAQENFTQLAPPVPLLPATIRAGASYSSQQAMLIQDPYGKIAWQGTLLEVITCDDAAGLGYDLSNSTDVDFDGGWQRVWNGKIGDPRHALIRMNGYETAFDSYGAVAYRNRWHTYYGKGVGDVASWLISQDSYGTPLFRYEQRLMAYRMGVLSGEAKGHASVKIQLVDSYGQPAKGQQMYAKSPVSTSFALFEDVYSSGVFTIDFNQGDLIDLYTVNQQGDRYAWLGLDIYTLAQQGEPLWFQIGNAVGGQQVTHDYTLHRGWNLISFPMIFPVTGVADFVQSVAAAGGLIHSIWSYQSGSNSSWQVYTVAAPEISTLTLFAPGFGYWVDVTVGTTVSLVGGKFVQPSFVLAKGWNLIGVQAPVSDIEGWLTIEGGSAVWGFQNGIWKSFIRGSPRYLNSLLQLQVGDAYYVR